MIVTSYQVRTSWWILNIWVMGYIVMYWSSTSRSSQSDFLTLRSTENHEEVSLYEPYRAELFWPREIMFPHFLAPQIAMS